MTVFFLFFGSKGAEWDNDVLGMGNVLEFFLTLYCMRGESWQHQTLPKPPPETITSGFISVGGCFGNIAGLWLSDKGDRIVM